MCVERTASTKVPSARESRARVACQYLAAACAEMFCPMLVCVWLMFNTSKITQPGTQIYPERFSKKKEAEILPSGRRSSFAGRWNCSLDARPDRVRRSDHQDDCGHNDRSGKDRPKCDRFPNQEPAQEQRHHRIDKRIRPDTRRRALLQNVNVRAQADAGTKHDQIPEREP